jgi:hypothetical protein
VQKNYFHLSGRVLYLLGDEKNAVRSFIVTNQEESVSDRSRRKVLGCAAQTYAGEHLEKKAILGRLEENVKDII